MSHLAAAPQRQLELAQGAALDGKRLFEAAQHFYSPQHGPWSLIRPQAHDRRFVRPEWEIPPFNLLATTPAVEGSWWGEWTNWLAIRSGRLSSPPQLFNEHAGEPALPDAPGDYVRR
jgi:poly(3-hydroxyalkanoate) synthetase